MPQKPQKPQTPKNAPKWDEKCRKTAGIMTGKNLTPKQHKALKGLLDTGRITEAATAANVSERTLYRWLTMPEFRTALVAAEGDAIDGSVRRLVSLSSQAADTLETVMQAAESDHVRLQAARAVFEYLVKLRDLRNVETRISELEKRIDEVTN